MVKIGVTTRWHAGGMRYDDKHLAVLKALTTESPWLAIGKDAENARHLALLCAIASLIPPRQ